MPARLITVEPTTVASDAVSVASDALRQGALIALPTETVYGIAAPATADGLARLEELKGRTPGQPFTHHVATVEEFVRRAPDAPARARRLAERLWPGPLTLVVQTGADSPLTAKDGYEGFRVPAHAIARQILLRAGTPVVATSANRAGEPPATEAAPIAEAFGEELAVIVDAGPSQLGEASTVVRVAPDGSWEILREGFIPREVIARVTSRQIVFVCTGNTCRSPMAEALLRDRLAKRLGVAPDRLADRGFEVRSAGTSAYEGGSPSEGSVLAMRARGIDISSHRSRPLTADVVEDANLIFTLGHGHARTIVEWWPEHAEKVFLIDPSGVSDPIGGTDALYAECADQIERSIDAVLDGILDETNPPREHAALLERAVVGPPQP